jgi:uncharacterized membrane protein
MTKEEFIRGLREALADAPDSIIIENVTYYGNYIDGEMRKGRTEADIMEELGEPQWIAKSILDACLGNTQASESTDGGAYTYSGGGTYEYDAESGSAYRSDYDDPKTNRRVHMVDLNKWYVKAILIAIPILIVLAILSIFGMAFRLAFAILFSPYFWGVIIVLGLFAWFRRR